MSDLSQVWLDKLQKSLNKLIRLVLSFNSFAHVDVSYFRHLDWLPIESRVAHVNQ